MKNIFRKNKNYNPLFSLLNLLNVKHTEKYTNKYFNEHPNKNDLFGLSKMLTHYGVSNMGIRIDNKEEDIQALETPFIAHAGGAFVAVEYVSQDNVVYHWNNKKVSVPINEFLETWTGITLVVEAGEGSIEPDYGKHQKEEMFVGVQKVLLIIGILVLIGVGVFQSHIYQSLSFILLFLLNFAGVYVGYLLVLKQMHIKSSYADKLCSLFAQGDCNDVLDSPAAKLWGVIGWSELGLSYFLSNSFILLFAPHLFPYLVLINICALPYSFWSVWYQKFKAKTWCPLCLIVQVIFWAIFVVFLVFSLIQLPDFRFIDILSVGVVYGIPFLIISLALPYLAEGRKVERITQEFNSLKMHDKVFGAFLKDQPYYPVSKEISNILLGNKEAKNLITIYTNPHCGPCARMHTRVERLLKENSKLCVQYVLASFSEELDSSSEFFLFVNRNFSNQERDEIYNLWFNGGSLKREEFTQKYGFDSAVKTEEYEKHKAWRKEMKISGTPTILINGYELPRGRYQIEDLAYFSDLDVDTK